VGSLAAAVLVVERSARLVRVHDVAATVDPCVWPGRCAVVGRL